VTFLRNFLTDLLSRILSILVATAILSGAILTFINRLEFSRDIPFFSVRVPLYSILLIVVVLCIFLLIRRWIGRLQICSANYGWGPAQPDVTDRVREHVHRGVLDVLVTTDELRDGNDPFPNVTKALTVNYRLNGRDRTIEVIEGSRLILP
jgi:hypothetical protein